MTVAASTVYYPERDGGRKLAILLDDATDVMTLLVALADAGGGAATVTSSNNGVSVSDRSMHSLMGQLIEQQKVTNLHLAELTGCTFEPGDGD